MRTPYILHANDTNSNGGFPAISIAETVPNGFFTVDCKWTVTRWNKAAERSLGVEARDITGKNLWEQFINILPVNFYTFYHEVSLQDIPVHFRAYWPDMDAYYIVPILPMDAGNKLHVSSFDVTAHYY